MPVPLRSMIVVSSIIAIVVSSVFAGDPRAQELEPCSVGDEGSRFWVYRDFESPFNHGVWTNWMPAESGAMISLNLRSEEDPATGATAVRIDVKFKQPNWCGIAVASKADYWGKTQSSESFDLRRAEKLVLHARGANGGESIEVKCAIAGDHPYGDSAPIPAARRITLTKSWQRYELPLAGYDLTRVITPFCFVTSLAHNPSGSLSFFLDDIYFELGVASGAVAPVARAGEAFLGYLRHGEPALVAFSPSGYDPRGGSAAPSRESLRSDLSALRPAFDGLVLYGYEARVTPALLALAAELGYRGILLGIWDPKSKEEISGVAELVRQYQARLALAICIGNEGIVFHRYTAEDLRAAADQIRKELGDRLVPLTTSEPFGQYAYSSLCDFGHFLAPNIHPVWDRGDLEYAEAASWVRSRARDLAAKAHKPVLVKETGFPSSGGERFTEEAQRCFWEAYVAPGSLWRAGQGPEWVSYAGAFEAFDLPWKALASGLEIEGHWGLLRADRKPHPAFSVWERRSAARHASTEATP